MDRIMVSTSELQIGYQVRRRSIMVMENLSVTARRGELVALIGRNGTGKSTLLKTITGLLPPLEGTVMIDGRSLRERGAPQLPRVVSYVSTEPLMVRNIRVREVVALGRFPYTNWVGTLTEADQEAVAAAMKATGITPLADRIIDSLSDGERQRTLIARSLAQDTGLMAMDEPTAFLDLPSRYSIVSLLRQLTREADKCVVYSTHDLDTAISEADKIWLMSDGAIYEGAPEDLLLQGTLAKAFESPMLTFSQKDGRVSLLREGRGMVALSGSGPAAGLTEKALSRCGFVADEKAETRVTMIEDTEGVRWRVREGKVAGEEREVAMAGASAETGSGAESGASAGIVVSTGSGGSVEYTFTSLYDLLRYLQGGRRDGQP